MTDFIGSGNHWRVLRVADGCSWGACWHIFRRHWDNWELIGTPFRSHSSAMTEAHRLARLHRG